MYKLAADRFPNLTLRRRIPVPNLSVPFGHLLESDGGTTACLAILQIPTMPQSNIYLLYAARFDQLWPSPFIRS